MTDVPGSRRYMSKSQRACDYCRSRKSACRITDLPPCRLCSIQGRACTFKEGTAHRKPRMGRQFEAGIQPALGPQSGMESPHGMQVDEMYFPLDHDISSLGDVNSSSMAESVSLVDENWPLDDPGGDLTNYDQLENQPDIVEDVNQISHNSGPGLSEEPLNTVIQNELHTLDDDVLRYLTGPTGEQDPNLLQHYRFSEHHEFWFKRLGTRETSPGPNPVLWMLSVSEHQSVESQNSSPQLLNDKDTDSLDSLVPQHIGIRLIKL